MVFAGYLVDTLHRHPLHGNLRTFQSGKQLFRQVALDVSLYQYLVDVFPCLNGFYHGTDTKYEFVLLYHSYTILYIYINAPITPVHC